MSKVLFFNIPAYGHTYLTLPLMAELAKRLRSTAENILVEPTYQQACARPGKLFGQPDGYVHDADEIQAFKRIHDIT
jgi:hypothetical protein